MKSEFKKGQPWPGLYRAKRDGIVVLFDGIENGTVVHSGTTTEPVGLRYDDWIDCTDETHWERVDFEVKATPAQPKKPTFPALYRARKSDLVVLFTDYSTGTAIHSGTSLWKVGYRQSNWACCTDDNIWEWLGPEDSVVLTGGDL